MDTANIPQFLNKDYFKKALENGLKTKDVNVTDLKFSMGSGPGENFLSSVYRIVVAYTIGNSTPRSVSLIVKVVPTIPIFAGASVDMHEKEAIMYFTILPEIEKGFQGKRISPKVYFAALEDPKTIVLEDLKDSGYILGDRQKGLDENHCKLVLEKLGQFHALSLIYAQKNLEKMKSFAEGIITEFSVKTPAFEAAHGQNFKATTELVESWPGYENVVAKMRKIIADNSLSNRVVAAADCSKDKFRVLNHGDMWANNFLFKYESDGRPADVIFVDYQCCVYGSPGNDINHFLALSPASDVLKNRHEYMVKEYYYQSFRRTLHFNGYKDIPSENVILDEIRRKESYGLLLAIGILPVVSMDASVSKDNTIDNIASGKMDSNMRSTLFSPRFQEAMRYWLKRADEFKMFD